MVMFIAKLGYYKHGFPAGDRYFAVINYLVYILLLISIDDVFLFVCLFVCYLVLKMKKSRDTKNYVKSYCIDVFVFVLFYENKLIQHYKNLFSNMEQTCSYFLIYCILFVSMFVGYSKSSIISMI